jgi:phosphatidylglycerophosphatase A
MAPTDVIPVSVARNRCVCVFRLYDIVKPGPVGWADRKDNITGVMLNDVIAGAFAAVCVIGLAGLWHGIAS